MSPRAENLRGIGWMVAAMALFAMADAFIKAASDTVPVGQVLIALGLGGGAIFAGLAVARGIPIRSPMFRHPVMLLRNGAEMGSAVCVVSALSLVPLATVSAILQAVPLAVTLGAALFLRADVGWRRWAAVLIGLAGVLVILRPGSDGFRPEAMLAVLGVVGLAVRDLTTRALPASVPSLVMGCYGFGALVPAGALLLLVGAPPVWPGPWAAAMLTAAVLGATLAYFAIITAMRTGEIAAVTPFRYSRLLFALVIAIAIFGERPDLWTYLGAGLIIGTGLFTLAREARASGRSR